MLFVDDEESIRITLSMMLESKGYSVTAVATVPEALRLIANQNFDVLIADLNIGDPGDGFTGRSRTKMTPKNESIPSTSGIGASQRSSDSTIQCDRA